MVGVSNGDELRRIRTRQSNNTSVRSVHKQAGLAGSIIFCERKKIEKTTTIDQQNRMQIEFICTPHGYEEEKKILSKRAGEIEKERKNIARNIYNIIIYVHNGE